MELLDQGLHLVLLNYELRLQRELFFLVFIGLSKHLELNSIISFIDSSL
jgi:hypothetical protein